MTSEEIIALCKRHTIFEWTSQQAGELREAFAIIDRGLTAVRV